MLERTVDRARGRWRGILQGMGLDRRYLTGKHGPCPFCGGKDRFRFTDHDGAGIMFCNQCGARSGMHFLMVWKDWDFPTAAREVDKMLGTVQPESKRTEPKNFNLMNRLWNAATPITRGDPAGKWLERRCGMTENYPDCLRYAADLPYYGENYEVLGRFSTMLAKVQAPDGRSTTIHRTYLTPEGRKPDLEPHRKLMPGAIPRGSAIRLGEPADELGVAEGIETALAAQSLWAVPVWACLNAGLMQTWQPPSGVAYITIFADHDLNFVGQAAGCCLAKRLVTEGKQVQVMVPDQPGGDWADIWANKTCNKPNKVSNDVQSIEGWRFW